MKELRITDFKAIPIDVRYEINRGGVVRNKITGRVLKAWLNDRGYLKVRLGGFMAQTGYMLHRLLAATFISNPENKATVNHIDGNKLNNDISNLEWATNAENIRHAFKTGLIVAPSGEACGASKLTAAEVGKIRALVTGKRMSQKEIAALFGVTRHCILSINSGRTWKENDMQSIRIALEEILQLADDGTYSHLARMLKIKGLASQALTDLNNAPVAKPKVGVVGGQGGNNISKKGAPDPIETF